MKRISHLSAVISSNLPFLDSENKHTFSDPASALRWTRILRGPAHPYVRRGYLPRSLDTERHQELTVEKVQPM